MIDNNSYTILVVDDDEGIRQAVRSMLELERYRVITADKSEDLERLDTIKPDLIILDVLLMGEDGRDIAKKLKSDPQTKDIPLLMFSAQSSAQKSMEEAGVDAFISKPFNLEELLDLITRLLQKNHPEPINHM